MNVHASSSDLIKIGFVGCGNRGTGACREALSTYGPVKLVAIGDLFADRIGFAGTTTEHVDTGKAVEKHFNPEFINRLDAIVKFQPLTPELMGQVAAKFVRQLAESLKKKGVEVELTVAGREWLAAHGYDQKLGARPMERLIKKEISEKIVDAILFGKLANGGRLVVDAKDGQLALEF